MLISPIIFCTITLGIAGMAGANRLGRVAIKAFIYFEVISTFALVIGLVVGNVLHPGTGFSVDPDKLSATSIQAYLKPEKHIIWMAAIFI